MEEKQKCRYIGEERGTCVKEKKQEGKRIKKKKDGRKLYILKEKERNLMSQYFYNFSQKNSK